MSVKPEVRKAIDEYLKDHELEGYFLDDQAYDDSIVGVDESTGRIIYDYDKMVEELASEYFFAQKAEDDEFQTFINRIDFVVLPYKRASQSGVIPMSFAFGKTVVSTRVGALEEQIPNGTGILVDPNSTAISSAISNLYANPSKIENMGRSARHYAQKELTWSYSADLLLTYLNNK